MGDSAGYPDAHVGDSLDNRNRFNRRPDGWGADGIGLPGGTFVNRQQLDIRYRFDRKSDERRANSFALSESPEDWEHEAPPGEQEACEHTSPEDHEVWEQED